MFFLGFYKIIKRADLLPFGAKVIGTWRDLSLAKKGSVSGDVLIKLAYCFRHSGQLDKALDASEVVTRHDRKVSLTHGQKAVLATERAAALLDLYNIRRDQSLLAQARRCAGIAWAIAQSNETSLVYQRLKSLE